jgi:hypothetical protein
VTPAQAAAIARRKNEQQRENAPLLAWAGLGEPDVTAEQVLERRHAVVVAMFWKGLEQMQDVAQQHAACDAMSFAVYTLVPVDVWEKVRAWADNMNGPVYVRAWAWRRALALAEAGDSPVPEAAIVHTSACWPDLKAAIRDRRWREEAGRHERCSREWCEVSSRARQPPIMLGEVPRG